jgi:hypothetical protein
MNWLRLIVVTVGGVMTAIVLLVGITMGGVALALWVFKVPSAISWYLTLTLPFLVPMSLAAGMFAGLFLYKKMQTKPATAPNKTSH